MDHKDFADLLDDGRKPKRKPQIIWISGPPGCGKTYLSAYLVELLEEHGPTGYCFCDTKSSAQKNVLDILRTWMWHLCEKSVTILGEILRTIRPVVEITQKVILKTFSMLLDHQEKSYLLLDGLDERDMKQRAEILELIRNLSEDANILIISRREVDIEQTWRRIERVTPVKRIQISVHDSKSDVQRYVSKEAQRLEIANPTLLCKIVDEIGAKAGGMFLFARLMLNELDLADTDEERFIVLQQLPEGIDVAYARSVDKI